jgi:hypothetical protein
VRYKKCTKCGESKSLLDFPAQKSNKDGRHCNCKSCRSVYYASIYNSQKRKNRYMSNHEVEKQKRKEYYKNNVGKYYINKAKRRATLLNATPKWYDCFDDFVLSEAYNLCKRREISTGVRWEVDHVVPLQGKTVCGLHWHHNWSVIPMYNNRSKGNTFA